ncbi:caspase family protein [Streptomyces sp. NPDC088921]|uniref:HD domain-containing protein n=1 Tax=unclassified Streptomyces TaxID=2593676 RepID=UPI0034489000
MTRYKALLIGVAQYEAAGISSLPFVREDLDGMASALKSRGFHQVQVAQAPYFTPNVINGAVSRFLSAAGQDDRLLVVLSGHGVHDDGKDYLVPQDFDPTVLAAHDGCVEIGWGRNLENTTAAQVVFLIDACREGVRDDTMGTAPWSSGTIAAALRRKVAYVYACSQAQVARYVRDSDRVRDGHDAGTKPGDTFSLFSRTVTDLLAGPVSTLAEFETAAQERVDALHTAYAKPGPAQRVRVRTEEDRHAFTLFPPTESTAALKGAERTWTETVTNHHAWSFTASAQKPSVTALKAVCGRLAARYARVCAVAEPKIADDPWYDGELAERTTERVGFLLLRLAEDTELSPTEAALLAVLPFAAQAHWAQQAARHDLSEAELDGFLNSFPRLGRRLRTLTQKPSGALSDVRWWGVHRWLVQHSEAFTCEFLTCDDVDVPTRAWAVAELSAPRLLAYLKEQRVAPAAVAGTVRSTALDNERQVAPSTPYEHTVRERLVSALLKAAHALAVDPADLPEVLVEHLGISDSVSLTDLRSTLRQSHWVSAGAGRSLSALCGHPAIELALRRHAETVDTLLRDINKEAAKRGSSLSPLASLPAYADAQQVRPSGAAPAELSSGIRFRLADDRVQELLMGEQLYGDRALAIRELYQNALDALRYRTARTEYLRRTGATIPEWQGEIVFTEGVDPDGRPYLECADNGIGMGVTELSRAFAQGGSRFVDLPEYREEGALWAALDPPVSLVPVSRFGLGVLSYFMIADELSVWTCRLDREGRPGHELKVTIAGPGNLFRVEDLGPGRGAGTRVRLYGVPGKTIPSSGEELEKYLWVSPYRVSAPLGSHVLRWKPRSLTLPVEEDTVDGVGSKRIGGYRTPAVAETTPYLWSEEQNVSRHTGAGVPFRPISVAECRQEGMWWTEGNGAVLVDGIANDTALFGRVVDLHGGEEATLTVDRKKLSRYDTDLVRARSLAAVDDLFDVPGLLSPEWLDALSAHDVELADAVTTRAAEKGVSWESYDWPLDVGRIGFFPPDLLLMSAVTGSFVWSTETDDDVAAFLILCMPENVLRWRLSVLHPDLPMGSWPVAKPSDLLLLTGRGRQSWGECVRKATEAYADSRYGSQHSSFETQNFDVHDLTSWRPEQFAVPSREVLATAVRQWSAPRHIATRLRELGYSVAGLGSLDDASAEDLALLVPHRDIRKKPSHGEAGIASPEEFVLPGGCVHLAHLYAQDDPFQAARRLQELGYTVPSRIFDRLVDGGATNQPVQSLARHLLQHSFGVQSSPSEADKVTRGQLLYAAACSDSSVGSVAQTLRKLGFVLPESPLPESTTAHQYAAAMSHRVPHMPLDLAKFRRFNGLSDRFPPTGSTAFRNLLADFAFPDSAPSSTTPGSAWREPFRRAGTVPDYGPLISILTGNAPATFSAVDEAVSWAYQHEETPLSPLTGEDRHATLAEIASAALHVHRPFREVAAKATELGFRHEAEDWWP